MAQVQGPIKGWPGLYSSSLWNWGDLCSHSLWHLYGLGCQCLVGMFGHEYSGELSLDGQLQLMAQGLTWGVQAGVCV